MLILNCPYCGVDADTVGEVKCDRSSDTEAKANDEIDETDWFAFVGALEPEFADRQQDDDDASSKD